MRAQGCQERGPFFIAITAIIVLTCIWSKSRGEIMMRIPISHIDTALEKVASTIRATASVT